MQKISKIWYFCLICLVLLLFAGGTRAWLHRVAREGIFPLENGAAWAGRQIAGRVYTLFRAQAAFSHLRDLEDEVARLRVDAFLLERVAVENANLRKQAAIPPRSYCTPTRCLVLSKMGGAGWWQSVSVNKGRSAGVGIGDAVVSPEGLVGRVFAVTDSTAEVRLITDPNSRIACTVEMPNGMPGTRGILMGTGWSSAGADVSDFLYLADPMRLDYLERGQFDDNGGNVSNVIPPRTRVVTSGLSGTIPGGIPVGWIVDTGLEPNGLYKTGTVLPAVDLANLSTLFVLINPGRFP